MMCDLCKDIILFAAITLVFSMGGLFGYVVGLSKDDE